MRHVLRPLIPVIFLFHSISFVSCKKSNEASSQADEVTETLPAIQTAVSVNVNANIGGFYVAKPARYDSTGNKYPLLIFIHGIGELGNGNSDLPKVLNNAVPNLLKNKKFPASFSAAGKNHSFVVISPQFKAWPSNADVNTMLNYAIANYRIDTTRIYVAGLSMGGGVTWNYAAQYASRIAALAPICGAAVLNSTGSKTIANNNLPVWAFHNTDDGTVSVNNTINNINSINGFNPTPVAIKTNWATGGHNAWTKATDPAYKENGMNMYEWMLQYSRQAK